MSSVDGSKTIHASSDQLFDHICGSCKTIGKETDAKNYCENCKEYLCESCADFHRKLPLLRNHSVVPAGTISGGKASCRLTDYCGCNTNQEVQFYCEDHADFICYSCQSIKHHKCTTPSIQQKCSWYSSASLDLIIAKTQSLRDAYDRLKKECQENEAELERSREACMKEIQVFRKEIDEFMNKLEQTVLNELDRCVKQARRRLDQHIKTLTTAIQMLERECTSLEKARNDGRKESMFIAETRVSTYLRNYQTRLDDLEKNHSDVRLTFERNTTLDDLQGCVDALGIVKCSDKDAENSRPTVLIGRQIQTSRKVNVRLSHDKNAPVITGCAFMPNGYLVACDNVNYKIKLFDSSLSPLDSLKLISNVYGVSIVDANSVIVTLPIKYQLQFVHVMPKLKLGDVIQMEASCWGVHAYGHEIFVISGDPDEIRVIDKQGNMKRRIKQTNDGSNLFSKPYNITVSTDGNKIFVSDIGSKSVLCMAVDGNLIYQYKDADLKTPQGLISDGEDNVLVCESSSSKVHVLRSNGKRHGTFSVALQNAKRDCPVSVAYRKSDSTLVVGYSGLDHILVCQLTN